MHLRLNMKFLGAILVHPVRRQNFAGKLHIRFYNIWDCVICCCWSKKYDCWLGTALIDFLIKYDRTKQTPRKLPYSQKFDTKLISLPIFGRRQIPFISSVLIVCLWSKTNLCLNFILKYKLPKLRRCESQVVSIPHTCHIFYTNKILHWENA